MGKFKADSKQALKGHPYCSGSAYVSFSKNQPGRGFARSSGGIGRMFRIP